MHCIYILHTPSIFKEVFHVLVHMAVMQAHICIKVKVHFMDFYLTQLAMFFLPPCQVPVYMSAS